MYDLTNTDELGNRIASFSFKNMQVRVVIKDGEPWFAAHDVAMALEYYKAADLTRLLKDDEKGMYKMQTLGGKQSLLFINEKGLYRAIFNSRKPEALAFQDWVFGEVLPAIRKQGFYGQAPAMEAPPDAREAAGHAGPAKFLFDPELWEAARRRRAARRDEALSMEAPTIPVKSLFDPVIWAAVNKRPL